MPFGGAIAGIAAFSAIKVLGYSGAGAYLNRNEGLSRPHPLLFGATRAGIGMVVGTSYGLALARAGVLSSDFAFYPGLIPVRLAEWLLVLWLFYRTSPAYTERRFGYARRGVAWSFLLDLPASFAVLIVPGGFWIC